MAAKKPKSAKEPAQIPPSRRQAPEKALPPIYDAARLRDLAGRLKALAADFEGQAKRIDGKFDDVVVRDKMFWNAIVAMGAFRNAMRDAIDWRLDHPS